MATTTNQQGFPVPTAGDDPDIPADLLALANAIERRVVGVYNSATDRNTKITSPQEGQFAYLKDVDLLTKYNGTAWENAFPSPPTFSSGPTVPANGSGTNGDVFFKV
jgi:hypothetical protein